MNRAPKVSGIVIFLNAQPFLRDAIESALAQTYCDWELLLVDDGSTDGSTELAKEYAHRYSGKIQYLHHYGHETRGMSASRNRGVREARGEYVAFLDADDVWVPHKLEEQVMLMDEHSEAAMCFGPTLVWHSWGENSDPASSDWYLVSTSPADRLIEAPSLLVRLLEDEWTCPCTCSVLVRRDVFGKIGAFEEEFRGQMEDMVFYSKVFLQLPVFVSSRCWGWYRQHANNSGKAAMASGEWMPHQPNRARYKYLRWVESYLAGRGDVGRRVREALVRELQPYEALDWTRLS
jgi:glycosyltransferase involved in cell wall biosynthesis